MTQLPSEIKPLLATASRIICVRNPAESVRCPM